MVQVIYTHCDAKNFTMEDAQKFTDLINKCSGLEARGFCIPYKNITLFSKGQTSALNLCRALKANCTSSVSVQMHENH